MKNNGRIPVQLRYTVLVHAGSYKDFLKKAEKEIPNMEILYTKQKAIHYYIIMLSEKPNTETDRKAIYNLPIIAMREEFSNYLFFKSVKAYNNVLKIMCKGKEDKDAPYILYQEMLTPYEKYDMANIDQYTKELQFSRIDKNGVEINTTVFGTNIISKANEEAMFEINKCKADHKEYNFKEAIKKEKLLIGIM